MATATSLNSGKGFFNAWDAVAASTVDSVLVAAKANKKIRLIAFLLVEGDTTASAVTFNSKGSGAGTAISPPFKVGANGPLGAVSSTGWIETIVGQALTVTTGAGSTTSIIVVCELVGA